MTWLVKLYNAGSVRPSRITTVSAPSLEMARRIARQMGYAFFRVIPNCPMEDYNA